MNASIMRRLFKAINESGHEDLRKIAQVIINDEAKKGHETLAKQLENIVTADIMSEPKPLKVLRSSSNMGDRRALVNLPLDRRYNQPLASLVTRSELDHHMVLPDPVEKRFEVIEKEFAARDRLSRYGLMYRKKILLYGSPGCGKTLGAQRLAWNTGLPLLKVRFDSILSSYLGESSVNLRTVIEHAATFPCLLLLDECDFIAKSRESGHDVGEMPRLVNTLLQLLDEYKGKGMIVATTNLQGSLDKALFRRFDDAFEIPKPGREQIKKLIQVTLSLIDLSNSIDWDCIINKLTGVSAAEIVKMAENAAKESILQGNDFVTEENLLHSISQTRNDEIVR